MNSYSRFSSSRTEISQVILIAGALVGFYISYTIILDLLNEFEIRTALFLGVFIGLGIACLAFSLSIYTLNISKGEIRFSSMFGKKVDTSIDKISKWGIDQFSLSFIDPMKMNRFSRIHFITKEGLEESIIIMNPSKMSKHHDIEELLNTIRTKHRKWFDPYKTRVFF